MAVAVPLEVEALPAGLEEGVEADVIVIIGSLDLPRLQQVLAFGANFLPMGLQRRQVGKIRRVKKWLVGDLREQIKEAIDRRQERRVIAQLAAQFVAYATTQVDIRDGYNVDSSNDEFHGNRHTSEVNKLRPWQRKSPVELAQRLKTRKLSRRTVLELMPTFGIKTKMAF